MRPREIQRQVQLMSGQAQYMPASSSLQQARNDVEPTLVGESHDFICASGPNSDRTCKAIVKAGCRGLSALAMGLVFSCETLGRTAHPHNDLSRAAAEVTNLQHTSEDLASEAGIAVATAALEGFEPIC